jgi:beta-glucosidase
MSELRFPQGFLWGAATAGHQIEGGNVNASMWPMEWAPNSFFAEPSGDACDSYHRYREDIALLSGAGLQAYRFSVEWSRIEPERGFYSRAALDHYRRMCEACREHGIEPWITLNHFTVPRWHTDLAGFANPDSVGWFRDYAAAVVGHLGDLVDHAMTFNEINIAYLLRETGVLPPRVIDSQSATGIPMMAVGETVRNMTDAHVAAREVCRDAGVKMGWTLAAPAFHALDGAEAAVAERRAVVIDPFLDVSANDDFVGLQTYTRNVIGPDGVVPPEDDGTLTETGWEAYPPAVAEATRYAGSRVDVPLYVTENGMATSDDARRIENTDGALRALHAAIDDGVDLRGYFHWSLLDNFEWVHGYAMHFGLIEVDRVSFERRPKPSLAWLGGVARANALS